MTLDHDPDELRIEEAGLCLCLDDLYRLVSGNGVLVRTISLRKRVEDITDREYARLDRYLVGAEVPRIPGAVQSLVMVIRERLGMLFRSSVHGI